jgi:hypothetical protein
MEPLAPSVKAFSPAESPEIVAAAGFILLASNNA